MTDFEFWNFCDSLHAEADMKNQQRILANADIAEIVLAPPRGHHHLRATIRLHSGEEIILQEATVANLVRAYVGIKTHPQRKSCRLVGRELAETERKEEFAAWQLLEEDGGTGS
jgi:hypothetical protein